MRIQQAAALLEDEGGDQAGRPIIVPRKGIATSRPRMGWYRINKCLSRMRDDGVNSNEEENSPMGKGASVLGTPGSAVARDRAMRERVTEGRQSNS